MNKKIIVFISAALMILAFILGAYFYKSHRADEIAKMGIGNAAPFVQEYSPNLGDKNAKVTLVEFMDPACEACSAFHPFVKNILNQNPNKINLVIRYAPFHQGADYCVKILEAARNQGMYWETLDLLFTTQHTWTHHHQVKPELVLEILKGTKLDLQQLEKEMHDPKILKIIKQDLDDAAALNVKRTPGFFVNGKPLENFGYEQLKALVISEIKEN